MKNKGFIGFWLSPWVIGWLVVLPSVWPYFQNNFFVTHDYTHVARLAEMIRTLDDGQVPPRWSRNLGFGFGMPLFSFYAPLPYYFGYLLHLCGLSNIIIVKWLFILTSYLALVSMFYLASWFWGNWGGWLAAIAFAYIPYRAVNLYVRGALGELVGMLTLTWGMLTLFKLLSLRTLNQWLVMVLAIGGLMLSHNILALIGLPILSLVGVWDIMREKQNRLKKLWLMLSSFSLGLGLAAFFIIPAYLEKGFTSVDKITQGSGDYQQHFVFIRQLWSSPFGYGGSIAGIEDGMSFEVGKIHLGLFALVFILWIFQKYKRSCPNHQVLILTMLFSVGSFYLTTFHSLMIWKYVPILKYVQFPWRWISIGAVFLSLSLGYLGRLVGKVRSKQVTLFGLMALMMLASITKFRPQNYLTDDHLFYADTIPFIQTYISRAIPDYINPLMSNLVMSPDNFLLPPSSRFEVESAQPISMTIVDDKTQYFKILVTAKEQFTFIANIFDFPGWKFWVNEEVANTYLDTHAPRMLLTIPEGGDYQIEGKLKETPIRLMADYLSLMSWLIVGGLITFKIIKDYR